MIMQLYIKVKNKSNDIFHLFFNEDKIKITPVTNNKVLHIVQINVISLNENDFFSQLKIV